MFRNFFIFVCFAILAACGVPQPDLSPPNLNKVAFLTEGQQRLLEEAETADTFSTAQEGFATALVLGVICEMADCNGFEILLATDLALGVGSHRQNDSTMADTGATFRPTQKTLGAHTTYATRVADRGDDIMNISRNVLAEAQVFTPQLQRHLAATPQDAAALSWTRKLVTLQTATEHLAIWHNHRAKIVERSLSLHDARGMDVSKLTGISARINAQAGQITAVANSYKSLVSQLPRRAVRASGGASQLDLTLPPTDS